MPPYDARAVANEILSVAKREGRPVSNLVLQKLVYFAHGVFLLRTGQPLVKGAFEAWQHGPVHPHVYVAFKRFGAADITESAYNQDPLSGEISEIKSIEDNKVLALIDETYRSLKNHSAASLRALSHAVGGPWHRVVAESENHARIGMRIPNELIRDAFNRHKISVGSLEEGDVPRENAPFT